MRNGEQGIAIRKGELDDLARLTEIYNHYVENTAITFDIDPFTIEQRREAWLVKYSDSAIYRLLVAVCDGLVIGYATSGKFREKPAYTSSVETSVYLDSKHTRSGVGTALYNQLFKELKRTPIHRAYAGITLPNEGSIALHQKMGFKQIGRYHEVGFKFGKYHDVMWFEKAL
ncbi:MAG: GNAT family N-acetyltransferase [Opitutales bacterium]|nr:GNAT family N-acetyltransferase [Opitutales bacterium]NRA26715.1 N-acetyltransferase family protein [Opitutales bacterium]